jgi:ribosomal protein L32
MKTTKYYTPYIKYSNAGKWEAIARRFTDVDTAMRCIAHIADVHSPTTRIALVCTTIEEDTIGVVRGCNDKPKNPRLVVCNTCGNKKFRKNINPKTGTCLACEMRKEVSHA